MLHRYTHRHRRTHAYGVQIIQRSPDFGEPNQKPRPAVHVCLLMRYIHIHTQAAHARQPTHQTKSPRRLVFLIPVQHAITRTSIEIITLVSVPHRTIFLANCCLHTISCHQAHETKFNKIISAAQGKGMWPPQPQPERRSSATLIANKAHG